MKYLASLVVVAVLVLGTFKLVAAEQPYKFGYVDFQRALNEAEEGKKAKAALKSEFDDKQKKLDVVQNELQAMKADLDKQSLILSADALKEKQEEYRKKFMELQQKLASYKEELVTKEAKSTSEILSVMNQIIKDIGQKDGYSLILEKSQDVVLYSPSDADLTARVIKEYNGLSKDKKQTMLKNATK